MSLSFSSPPNSSWKNLKGSSGFKKFSYIIQLFEFVFEGFPYNESGIL